MTLQINNMHVCIGNHRLTDFLFGIYLHKCGFQKVIEIARVRRANAIIILFKKYRSAKKYQIEREKSYDYP